MNEKSSTSGPTLRRRSIIDATASPHLAGLSLPQLRAYRSELTQEEEKVSYWRRLAHARMDVLQAESDHDGRLSVTDLIRVLGDTGSGARRTALVSIRPAEPLPDLPVLAEMWNTEVDPTDPEATREELDRLRQAERRLTEYRHALHERIDEATSELIVRYRADPASALTALPVSR